MNSVVLRMSLKVIFGLCFFGAFLEISKAQRGWGKPQNSYNSGNTGFSSWGSNSGSNSFLKKQNSNFGSWGLNVETNTQPTSNPFQSFNSNSFGTNNNENSISNSNSWGSMNSKDTSSNFNSGNTWNNYDSTTESRKKSEWNSNFETNKKPTSGLGSNSWESNFNSGNMWDSYDTTTENRKKSEWNSNFGTNKKPTSDIGSNSWESNFNKETSSNFDNGNKRKNYETTTEGRKKSGWNSNKSTTIKAPKKQNTNNGNSENWKSEAFSSNNKQDEKKLASIMNAPSLGKWDTNSNSLSSNTNNNDNSIYSSWDTSNMDSSNSNNGWGSDNNFLDNNNLNTNEVFSSSDYEDNSVFSSFDSNKKKNPTSNWQSNNGNSKNNENSESSGWSSNSNKPNKKPSGSNNNNWGSNTSSNSKPNEIKPTTFQSSNSQEQNQPSQKKDHSVLDELDQNEWYFGSASNYPSPPFKTNLNIDVSELWNFDNSRKATQSSGGNKETSNNKNNKNGNSNNKRRRNRQTEECVCVDVNFCDEEDMIISQDDLENWRPLEEFRCPALTEVCCTNPKIKESTRSNIMDSPPDSLHCGQRKMVETFSDLGEIVAQPGEFPWNLKIIDSDGDRNCSASLIHSKMAITAAHCVDSASPNSLKVKAGLWNTNKEPFQSRRVMKIILHPDYYSANPRNDIALLILENPFKLTDNVNTVCLPVTNDKWDWNQCFVAGWRPKEINDEVFDVLEKGTVTFLPQRECQNIMLVTDLWREYILHDSFVCGIEKSRKDKCLGDEGSPVICPSAKSPDTYLQVAIVSNPLNCDHFGRPGIFTNLVKFLDWVNENAFDLGLFDDIDIRTLQ